MKKWSSNRCRYFKMDPNIWASGTKVKGMEGVSTLLVMAQGTMDFGNMIREMDLADS